MLEEVERDGGGHRLDADQGGAILPKSNNWRLGRPIDLPLVTWSAANSLAWVKVLEVGTVCRCGCRPRRLAGLQIHDLKMSITDTSSEYLGSLL